ncbi:conserved repeat protein, partial [Xenococcus sp. PCC 7305]|uniref:DUF11 domain-containing protein n=1 Tax=Xenococcus sp. PCC 7305 TaxID=102125 RepID=UPI0002AD1328
MAEEYFDGLPEALPIVETDKADYAPGETVVISGSNYAPNSTVEIQIADDLAAPGDDGEADIYHPILVTVDEYGVFTTDWTVPIDNNGTGSGIPDALNATLNLTATGDGVDGIFETDDDQVAITTFTDAGGAYDIDFRASDPTSYSNLVPAQLPPINGGTAADPLDPPPGEGTDDASSADVVTSLAPDDLGLGQIVAFQFIITVDGDTSPENGVIELLAGWNAETTNGGDFGYDETFLIYGAFIDTSDPAHIDGNADGNGAATVAITNEALIPNGSTTGADEIRGTFEVSGLDDGDTVVLEVWVVLEDTIPPGTGGTVQSRLIDAETADGDAISTGNQTNPLLRVFRFFNAEADIAVTKTDDPDPVGLGDTLTYFIEVTNNSTDTVANGVTLTDVLDPNTTFVQIASVIDTEGVITTPADFSEAGGTITGDLGFLVPGETVIIEVEVTVNDDAPTIGTENLLNTVTVDAITNDPDDSNNTATEPTDVLADPEISITKTFNQLLDDADGSGDISPGDTIEYSFEVTNTGDVTLFDVSVDDPLVGPVTLLDTELDPLESTTGTATYVVLPGDLGNTIINTATATGDPDPNTPGDEVTATDSENVDVPESVLEIVKTNTGFTDNDGSGDISEGDFVLYDLTATNIPVAFGGANLTNVVITDDLTGDTSTPLTLGPNESDTLSVSYTVLDSDLGTTIENIGTADSDQTDPVTDPEGIDVP